jgi:hypothetical protein
MTAPLLFFAFACFLSTITSRIHDVSITEFSRILSVVVMALVLERLATTPAAVRRIMIAAVGSAIVPLVGSFAAYLIGAPLLDRRAALADGIERVRGTFDQANGFSRYLLFIIIMAVAMFPHLPKRARIPMLIGITGLGVLMVLTYTRSSWLALLIGLMVSGCSWPWWPWPSASRCSFPASWTASPISPPTTVPTRRSPAKATPWRGGCRTGVRSSRSPSTTR